MYTETVTEVKHLTDNLFSFKTTRSPGFRFEAGQFTMIGLDNTPKRAYSMVSGPSDDYLEFLSIVVEDGPLTSELVKIKVGDPIKVGKKAVGTLITDSLIKGKNLWLIGTGTGIAPFVSICRDAKSYLKFENIIVCHTVRTKKELAYYDYFFNLTMQTMIQYFPTVTRDDDWPNKGRITNLIKDDSVFKTLELPKWSPDTDAVMLCGSTDFNKEMMAYLKDGGWNVGTLGEPATYVYEKAFVG
tara:strand:- start:2368 stop:3096 length:729 start_codon:yes stop_codon:yes gene_type:complete